MITTLHQTQVDLDGLLDVLGKNLYSSPAVVIRELIQNAHDACIRRQIEDSHKVDPQIRVRVDEQKGVLWIEDNGSGLTQQEITDYLATIGSGYTRTMRQTTGSNEMIGYYGLGFLSAYIVSEKVDVWTTSYQQPNESWRFTSKGGQQFTVQPVEQQAIGATIRLNLTAQYHELSVASVLTHLIQRFCSLLPIPIYLADDDTPINQITPPWLLDPHISDLQRRKQEFAFAELFESAEPICAIVIPNDNPLDVKGLLWVQGSAGYATSDYRNVTVFIRNMFITNEARDLLPTWAGFAGCVIETHRLTPTASREDIQTNAHYEQVKILLAQVLIDGLSRIAKQEPATWRRVISRHNQALLGSCVSDGRLFHLMRDELKLPTSMGELTAPALLKHGSGKLYVQYDEKSNYETILFRARMQPLIKGYMFAVIAFCQQYAREMHAELLILGTQKANEHLFDAVAVPSEQQKALSQWFQQPQDEVICTEFEPAHIPLIMVDDQEVKLKERIEQDSTDQRMSKALLGLARMQTNSIDGTVKRRIYVNLSSKLVQGLFALTEDHACALATTLRTFTVALAQQDSLEEKSFAQELDDFNASLLTLIGGLK